MAVSNLDVKIKTLVEGLQQIGQLSTELNRITVAAANASSASARAGVRFNQLGAGSLASQEAMKTLNSTLASLQGGFGGIISSSSGLAAALQQIKASNDQLGASINGLNTRVDALGKGFRDVPGPANDAGKSIASAMQPADRNVGILLTRVKQLAVGFVALAGVMGLKAAADLAARTETLGITLEQVGGNAGYSAEEIKKYTAELKALGITTGAARSSLTQLVQAGINLTAVNEAGASTAAQLARASQDLAVVTGENSSDTLSRLILNIRQMDTQGLRYLGLNVDIAAAQSVFAQSLGKSADALTQSQKQQAVLNAAMLDAQKLAGSYEASLASVGKQLGSMTRYQEEAGNAIGSNLLPAYALLVAEATDFLKVVQRVAEEVESTTRFSKDFALGIGSMSSSFSELLSSLVILGGTLAPTFGGMVASTGDLIANLTDIVTTLVVAGDESKVILYTLNTAGYFIAGLADGVKVVYGGFLVLAGYVGKFVAVMLTGLGQIAGVINTDLGDAIKNAASGISDMSDESLKAAGKISDDFAAGRTAVQRFHAGVIGASAALAEVGKGSTFSDVAEDIRVLVAAQRDNKVTSDEAAEAAAKITANIKALGDTSDLTAAQVAVLNTKVASAMADTSKQFTEALTGMGFALKSLGDQPIFVRVSKDLQEVNGRLTALAGNTLTTKAQFDKAFATGLDSAKTVDDIATLSANLKEAGKNAIDTSTAAALAGAKFSEVLKADIGAAKTVEDLQYIKQLALSLGEQQIISSATVVQSLQRVDSQLVILQTRLSNREMVAPIEALGLSFDEVANGVTAAGRSAADSLQTIITNLGETKNEAGLMSDELLKVFNGGLGQAKTLGDLQAISGELLKARGNGEEFQTLMASAATETTVRFNELFQAQLKSANTKVEFDALRSSVTAMGTSGAISATLVATSLSKIEEAATGAKEAMAEVAKQETDVAQQRVSLAGADNAVLSAGLTLESERKKLTQLTNASRKEGSAVTKEEVNLQKAVVREASALQALAKARYNSEKADLDALIAKQKALNAQKLLSLNPADETLQAAAAASEKEAEAKELVAEKARSVVAAQELVVKETEKAKIRAEDLAKALNSGKDASKGLGDSMGRVGASASLAGKSIAGFSIKSAAAQLESAGFEQKEAARIASGLLGGQSAIAAFGSAGIAAYRRVTEGIQKAIEAKKRLGEKASEVTSEFSNAASRAQAIADGVVTGAQATGLFSTRANELEKAMAGVKLQAYQTIKGSVDAAKSFISSAQGIQQELLQAQGREGEAAEARFAQRKQELTLEYEMLKAKIQGSIVTAEAAGVSSSALRISLAEANSSYSRSISALRELENVDRSKRKEAELARKKEEADKANAVETEIAGIEKVSDAKRKAAEPTPSAQTANTGTQPRQGLRTVTEEQRRAFQRLSGAELAMAPLVAQVSAETAGTGAANSAQLIAKESGTKVTKVVELKFIDEKGQKATATVPEEQSQRLIDILDEFRRRT